jgi:hypothetical protein
MRYFSFVGNDVRGVKTSLQEASSRMANMKSIFQFASTRRKILLHLALALLLAANILQIHKNINLRSQLYEITRELQTLERNFSSVQEEYDLAGKEISVIHASMQDSEERIDRSPFKLLAIFSSKDCSSCITEEMFRWERVRRDHNIPVLALCVDQDSADVDRYPAKYNPGFPVLHNAGRIFGKVEVKRTPVVLLLDRKNKIVLAQVAEAGNDAKRERFYYQVSQIVSSVR